MAKLVYYAGDVQGVGFRATAAGIARRYSVRGWVRNLPDGRVQLMADGPTEAVGAFLHDLRESMREHIRTEDVFDRDPDEPLDGFRITH